MLGKEIGLFKIFGVEIAIDYSWFWIFLLITFSFAASYLPAFAPGKTAFLYVVFGLIGSFLFFLSIILHELTHTLIARKNDLPVKRITLFIFGGASNLTEEPKSPAIEFKMAIAGPISSAVIAGILFGLLRLLPSSDNLFYVVLRILAVINLGLAIFNMIPGFPLDGGRVLRSIIWAYTNDMLKSTRIAATAGKIVAIGLGFLGFFEIIIGSFLGGIWMLFISFFLYQLANSSYEQTLISLILGKTPVEKIMNQCLNTIDGKATIIDLLEKAMQKRQNIFLVSNGQKAVGLISSRNLTKMPPDKLKTNVENIMIPLNNIVQIIKTRPGTEALTALSENKISVLLVKDGQEIIGTLTYGDIRRFLMNHTSDKQKG